MPEPSHVSFSKLKHLPSYSVSKTLNDNTCEACVLAKYYKLSFSVSNSTSYEYFELIHIDLWGPYQSPTL